MANQLAALGVGGATDRPWYKGLTGAVPNPIDAWDAEGAASYAASLIGQFAGTVLAEVGGGPVNWAADVGWSGFLGLTRCLNTGILVVANSTIIVKFTGMNTVDWKLVCGGRTGAGQDLSIYPRAIDMIWYNNSSQQAIAPGLNRGILGMGAKPYRNGVPEGVAFDPWGGGAPGVGYMHIGAFQNTGVVGGHFSGNIAKFAMWAPPRLTDAQMADVTAAAAAIGLTVPVSNFFLQAYTGSRNNYSGTLGFQFAVGASNITVRALGRSISTAMAQNHQLGIWDLGGTLLATVTVCPASPVDALGYAYELLSMPVTLTAGAQYIIGSQEFSGGDRFMDSAPISSHNSKATVDNAMYSAPGGFTEPIAYGTAGEGFVVPTFYE